MPDKSGDCADVVGCFAVFHKGVVGGDRDDSAALANLLFAEQVSAVLARSPLSK